MNIIRDLLHLDTCHIRSVAPKWRRCMQNGVTDMTKLEGRMVAMLWRYDVATMATETATIRVARRTRDLLAEQASERGISLSMMLAEFAREADRDAALRSERHAARADSRDSVVDEEEGEWETAVGDGIN